jgi:transposase
MAIIPQQRLFGWEEIEELGDLERLRLVLEYMPDEDLMEVLEQKRGNGRNDYPVRAIWNSILAGIVYQHSSVESLRRELSRNGQLRYMCGLDSVPSSYAYSRFLSNLLEHSKDVHAIFGKLVDQIKEVLPDFGKILAIDGKAIETHSRPKKNRDKQTKSDRRRDMDADFGKKQYKGKNKDGTLWEKVVSWFGYKLHLVIDAEYELPIAFEVTAASKSEVPQAHKLIDKIHKKHPIIIKDCECFLGDKGYDDGKLVRRLWDEHRIKPIIDIRNMWQDGEATNLVAGQTNIVYDYRGTVYCYCLETRQMREMANGGFEKDRETLKYRCPADHYGIECKSKDSCPVKSCIRIRLSEDRRVFTPVSRSSYKWDRLYKKRPAIERVHSRLDVSFGFENHFVRGLGKMKLKCALSFSVMLAMALGRIKQNQRDKMRSLVKSA